MIIVQSSTHLGSCCFYNRCEYNLKAIKPRFDLWLNIKLQPKVSKHSPEINVILSASSSTSIGYQVDA